MLVNTFFLYFRVVVNTVLVLLSTRYILNALGVVDYGIYAVVGGIMAFLGFITSAMATSSQRHLAYELGQGDIKSLSKVFNSSLGLHLLLAVAILVIAETLGLWFLNNVLNIPEARQDTAFWVFQFTVIASISYVIAVPYQALFTAHEALVVVALIGVAQSVANFILALWLIEYTGDHLMIYGLLATTIAIGITLAQVFLSRYRYTESSLRLNELYDTKLSREIAGFTGWSLFGTLSIVARSHGLVFILNVYFGPVANAAMAIANQVYAAVSQFTQSILQAVSPRLVKHEGAGNREHIIDLALLTCKYSFVVACIWSIPLFAEMHTVLNLWLNNPPESTVMFCRLILVVYVIDQLSAGLTMPFQAIGKIARYQVVSGTIHLLTLPLALLFIILDFSKEGVLYASIITVVINSFLRGYLLGMITNFSYFRWLREVVSRGLMVIAPALLIVYIIVMSFSESFGRLMMVTVCSSSLSIVVMYIFGMDKYEKLRISAMLSK